jgi:preprotein translocase subunit SecE
VAKAKAKSKGKRGNAIVRYVRETRTELRKVNWPTREETIRLTQIVLVVTIVMGLFLWLMDILFRWWLGNIVVGNLLSIGLAVLALVGVVAAVVVLNRQQS